MKHSKYFPGASATRLKALAKALELQDEINVSWYNHDAVLQIKDGGLLFFHNCFLLEFEDYILVFPEHSEITVQHKDELEYWSLYKHAEILKASDIPTSEDDDE